MIWNWKTENELMAALKEKSSFSGMARADGMKPMSQLSDFALDEPYR